jgi:flagellar motility protein MotE (MotC chaperone)
MLAAALLAAKAIAVAAAIVDPGTTSAQAEKDAASPATKLAVRRPEAPKGETGARAAAAGEGADVESLLEALARRQAELEAREKALAAREEKLALYDQDVTAKLAQLETVAKSLKQEMGRADGAADEAAQSLAKVYGAMKPAAAAPLLDQLDEATALRILTRMKEKQVGEILPLMNRDRAVVLTRSLAGMQRAQQSTAERPAS